MNDNIVLEFKNIIKKYPGVDALKDVSFDLRKGEVHALLGENGAGKSTLIKTCSGAVEPTSGTIVVHGEEFSKLSPILSRKKGIAVVYQELNLINELPIYENIFLGHALRKGIFMDKKAMVERSKELFEQLEIKINPYEDVKKLSIGYQQMVEIAKAISVKANILIMDEPSAALTNNEQETLFKIIKILKESGVSIIYISHRLEEVFKITDRVSVIRDGELIKTMNTADSSREELVRLMVGRDLTETFPQRKRNDMGEPVLELEQVTGNGVHNVSLTVNKGEILGLGGLIGAGRTELAHILFGIGEKKKGKIKLYGKEISPQNPTQAVAKGIALIPEDRKRQGVLLHMTIKDNITMPILKKISILSVINRSKELNIVEKYHKSLDIRTPSILQIVRNLSGGNQQKVVLAKWLAAQPEVIIFDEPTRGIDVGAKQEIYQIMNRLTEEGKTLIMISSEMEELMGVSDRIVVLSEGKVTAELQKNQFDQEVIMEYASA